MRFMFRIVVWGFIALLVLPSVAPVPVVDQNDRDQASLALDESKDQFSTSDAVYMAVGVSQYLREMCSHDAELCESGGRLIEATLERAKQGAVVLAHMVEEHRTKVRETQDQTTTSSIQ